MAEKNRHHILFMRRNWNAGMAKELRNEFVYLIDVKLHEKLHATVGPVPKPPPNALKTLYTAFYEQRRSIRSLDLESALEWLIANCDYEPFKEAIRKQRDLLTKPSK